MEEKKEITPSNHKTATKGGDKMFGLFKKKDNVNDNNKDDKGNNKKVSSGKLFPYKAPKEQDTNTSADGKNIKGFKWL